ncbi:unnamed protein product [Pipistrellus nathusii]|uniref:Uncharacterized protein n=1 Tax=Pipistrellus nathusii TaxID=59473 RepID=A0ABN9ZA95_PIPNA
MSRHEGERPPSRPPAGPRPTLPGRAPRGAAGRRRRGRRPGQPAPKRPARERAGPAESPAPPRWPPRPGRELGLEPEAGRRAGGGFALSWGGGGEARGPLPAGARPRERIPDAAGPPGRCRSRGPRRGLARPPPRKGPARPPPNRPPAEAGGRGARPGIGGRVRSPGDDSEGPCVREAAGRREGAAAGDRESPAAAGLAARPRRGPGLG